MKTLLSLYDYSGQWAEPFAFGGWNVIQWDLKLEVDRVLTHGDIMEACTDYFYEHIFDNYGTVDAVIAAQPCTEFAVSGARWFKEKDEDGRTAKAIEMVYQTLAIIDLCMPDWWALENPISRIHNLVPELGSPRCYFQPYEFGDPYTKRTALYGNFNAKMIKRPVEPTEGNMVFKYAGNSEKGKEMRSMTPPGFAQAFYEANKDFIYSPPGDQLPLF